MALSRDSPEYPPVTQSLMPVFLMTRVSYSVPAAPLSVPAVTDVFEASHCTVMPELPVGTMEPDGITEADGIMGLLAFAFALAVAVCEGVVITGDDEDAAGAWAGLPPLHPMITPVTARTPMTARAPSLRIHFTCLPPAGRRQGRPRPWAGKSNTTCPAHSSSTWP